MATEQRRVARFDPADRAQRFVPLLVVWAVLSVIGLVLGLAVGRGSTVVTSALGLIVSSIALGILYARRARWRRELAAGEPEDPAWR